MHFTCTVHFQSRSAVPQNKKVLGWECAAAPKQLIQPTSSSSLQWSFSNATREQKGETPLSTSLVFPSSLRQGELPFVRYVLCWWGKSCTFLVCCLGSEYKRSAFDSCPLIDYSLYIVYIQEYQCSPKMQDIFTLQNRGPPYESKNCNWKMHIQFLIFK